MSDSQSQLKLAGILGVKPETILALEKNMEQLTGKSGVADKIVEENDQLINKRLNELRLDRQVSPEVIQIKLNDWITNLEKKLTSEIGGVSYDLIIQKALSLFSPPPGFFIKKAKAAEMLKLNPPQNILKHFGYTTVEELIEKEGLEQVYSAMRFIESSEWMNTVFINSYNNLTFADFEERAVEVIVLNQKWLEIGEKFVLKKYHNLSHLKELGIIFIIPIVIDTDGELLRAFTLLLHYLNEVPFYSGLSRKFGGEENFSEKLMSLLRGDVPGKVLDNNILIIQRYLAKDDPNDSRLFMPHVNPEAEHWHLAGQNLSQIPGFENCSDYDFVSEFFGNQLISFNLIDMIMSVVDKKTKEYNYHQKEALWNKIFIEYFGRDKINQLIAENIINGYIK